MHLRHPTTGTRVIFHLVFALMVTRASLDFPISHLTINVGGKPISAGALLNLFVVFIGLLYVLQGRKLVIPRIVVYAWGPFLVISLISIAYTPEMVGAMRKFLVTVSYVSITLIAYKFDLLSKNEGVLLKILLLSSIVPILYVPVDIVMSAASLPGYRVKSVFPHPNILAFYSVLLILYFYHYLSKRNLFFSAKHCLIYLSIFGLIVALLLTQTRAAWAALYLSVLIYSAMTRPKLAPLIAVVPFIALLEPNIRERIFEVFLAPSIDVIYLTDVIQGRVRGSEAIVLNSYEWRKVIWEFAFAEAWQKPLLGHGLDSFMYYSRTFSPLSSDATGAHSMYVKYLFEMGIVGFTCFVSIFAYLIVKVLKYRRTFPADAAFVFSLLLFYLLISYSDNIIGYLSFNWYFWFLIGTFFAGFAHRNRTPANARRMRFDHKTAAYRLPFNPSGHVAPDVIKRGDYPS